MTIHEHIKEFILSNRVDPEKRRIGVELECIFYDRDFKRIPVNPCDRFSATDALEELNKAEFLNAKGISLSLEPGGQIEWGSPPFVSLHDIHAQLEGYMAILFNVAKQHGLYLADYAMDPLYGPDEVELINLKKYQLMHDRFAKIGERGAWMMRCSSSVQVNIDLTSESDAEEMAFIADCITPMVSLLFSNSPFEAGRLSVDENLRYCIWNETDPVRTGSLLGHGIDEPKGLINKLCEYVTTVPAIFIIDKDGSFDGFDGTLGEWLKGLSESGELDRKDVLTVLHQIFTHVRFKNVIEIRGMDRPPRGYEMAPVAFWTGILTVKDSRMQLVNIIRKWTNSDRRALQKTVEKIDTSASGPQGKTLEEWIHIFCDIALQGLDQRSKKFDWENERIYLEPYLDMIRSGGILSLSIQEAFNQSRRSLQSFILERIVDE